MITAPALRRLPNRREARRLLIAWLLFCCCSFGSLPVFARQQHLPSADLVYCPLQRLWVEKFAPPQSMAEVREPLADICASNSEKNQFSFEVSRKISLWRFIANSKAAEKLFFDYARKGRHALPAGITAPPNAPERGMEKANAELKVGANNFQNNFDRARSEIFTLPQAARPPTALETPLSEFICSSFKLEAISRRIKPRAPPVSI